MKITITKVNNKISPSEAIYGFAGWLTCRKESITIGSNSPADEVADLVKEWCNENNLSEPRNIFPNNIKHPKS